MENLVSPAVWIFNGNWVMIPCHGSECLLELLKIDYTILVGHRSSGHARI